MNKNGVIAVVVVVAAVLLIGIWVMGSGGQRRAGAQVDCSAPPEAPTSVSHSLGDGSTVTVTWEPPSGTERPTTYVIEAGNAPGLNNAGTYVTPGSVTNLARPAPPGTFYARVFSRNACGTSAASEETVITVP